MKKFLFLTLSYCISIFVAQGQETFIPFGSDEYHLLDRMETRSGNLSNELFLNTQPVSRMGAVDFLFEGKTNFYNAGLTNVDFYNINRAISISGEWKQPDGDGAVNGRHPVLNTFYTKEPDLINYNKNGVFIAANPILSFAGTYDKDGTRKSLFNTTQGAEIRGKIKNGVGFYFSATNNYEEVPGYVNDWIAKYDAIPGAGKYKVSGNGYQYLKFRGYVNVPLIPEHISLTLGYDQHFLGDGYRSLFLSDFTEGAAFASINTKIWKFNYQNLYMMLKQQSAMPGELPTVGNKYATVHFLSLNATRWLNIGLFESVTFSRNGSYPAGYLNPIIFYRAVERANGSPDKVSIGFSTKAIIARHVQLYSQLLINEFTTGELFSGNGYWANKWAVQFGAKYFDAFGISNLDLQAETNIIRPYTYQHYENLEGRNTPIANYTSYNQSLAHPLGAGLAEIVGIINYQPVPRLNIAAKAMFYKQGIDTNGTNVGSNLLLSYITRTADYGIKLINGPESTCTLFDLHLAYELRPRLYIDLSGTYRRFTVENDILPVNKTLYFTAGLRLNLARRNYTQF
jgi:hypothetical protein